MVKLKGPISSLGARGSIAGAITVSNWKGRSYLKTKSLPTDPKTPIQGAHRLMMTWLATQWPNINAIHIATWSAPALQANIPPRNAFIAENLRRFHLFKSPTKKYPATEDNDLPFPVGGNPWPVGQIHALQTKVDAFLPGDTWGYFLFQLPYVDTTSTADHLIAIYEWDGVGPDDQFTTPLVPGSYHYTIRYFTDDGKLSPQEPPKPGTVLDYA